MTLKHIFGETPIIKILDFLIDHTGYDYSKTEIAEHAGIGWTTISHHWSNLEKWGLVVSTRQIGRATMYKLNTDHSIVAQMIALDESISEYRFEMASSMNVVEGE